MSGNAASSPTHYTSSDDETSEPRSGRDRLDAISRLLMSIRHPDPHQQQQQQQPDVERNIQNQTAASPSSPRSLPTQQQQRNVSPTVTRAVLPQPQETAGHASTALQYARAALATVTSTATSTTAAITSNIQLPSVPSVPTFQPAVQPASGGGSVAAGAVAAAINEDGRYCWVCFATDEDDELAEWVQPCNCTGTIRWVHQGCLQRWVDEKQKGNSMRRVQCPQCQTEYIIVYPAMSFPVQLMERIDTMIKCLSPFLAAGILVGSLYWTAVTFGAVTVLQVVGQQDGLDMMENADALVLLIGLPAIPVGLVLGRMVRWEDMVLRLIQNRRTMARKFPLISLLLPMHDDAQPITTPPAPIISDQVSGTRIFCGALLLPTISAIMGRLFFDSVQNNVHRTLIGGLTFVALKGAIKIYFRQKQLGRKKQRKILDYTDENQKRFVPAPTASGALPRGQHQQQQREVVI